MRRVGASSGRLAWVSLCLLPIGVGVGRFWPLYVAPADGLAYQYRSVALYPADALVVITCAGWLAWRLGHRPRPHRVPATALTCGAVALLAGAAAASVISATDRLLALGVALQLALLAVFCLAAADLLAHFSPRPLLVGIALAVLGEAALATWQALAQTTAPAGLLFHGWARELTAQDHASTVVVLPVVGRWLRSYGSFAHPNILGGYLALALAALAMSDDPTLRRLRSLAIAAGLGALLLTFSRAAWLAVLLGAFTGLLAGRGLRVPRLSGSQRLAMTLTLALLAVVVVVRAGSLGTLVERNSIQTRLYYNSVAWEVVARGVPVGAGNLVVAQQRLLGAATAGTEPAHDVFLIAVAELGPLGPLAWLAMLASLLIVAWQRRADPGGRVGPLAALAVMAPLLLFDHYLWTQPPGRVLLVWGLIVLVRERSPQEAEGAAAQRMVRATERSTADRVGLLACKRGIDVLLATVALVTAAPMMGIIALVVWLESGTPVIFPAQRLGRWGRRFTMYKFRTMTMGSDLAGLRSRNVGQGMVKIPDDPRVTRIGSWLRRFSLDELPQLWNVVLGDMSLVGPRPHDVGEVSPGDELLAQRLTMRPGLTGLWQVRARTNPSLAVRVGYDLSYISRWSPLLDLAIMLETIPVVLRAEGGRVLSPDLRPRAAE